jgi:4'-phosphopantetheinyl transferase
VNGAVPARSAGQAGPIGHGTVQAWLVSLNIPLARSLPLLDETERTRVRHYLRAADGARFAAGRAGLRQVLASYLGEEPASVRFRTNQQGRLSLADHGRRPQQLRFSLARTADLALIAVGRGSVGADIELIAPRPGLADLAAARFSAPENARIARGCCGAALRCFYWHWTAKEAYLKATGRGLADLRSTELICCDEGPALRFGSRRVRGLAPSFAEVSPDHAAVVVAGHRVTSWRWLAA